MTMTPDRFQQLLDQSTSDAPPAPPIVTDVEAGRGRLRRRRVTSVASATLAVVVVAGGVGLATRIGNDDRGTDPITPPSPHVPAPPAQAKVDSVVDSCAAELPQFLLGSTGRVMATAASAYEIEAVFASAQGRYWADCSFDLFDPNALPQVTAYDSQTASRSGLQLSAGPGCADPAGCGLFSVSFTDRVNPVVAALRVDLWDGSSTTIDTTDGYYAFTALRPLPDGATFDKTGKVVGSGNMGMLKRVTYVDASGTPIAAEVFDGSGGGQFGGEVDGLPTLDAYPSLKGER